MHWPVVRFTVSHDITLNGLFVNCLCAHQHLISSDVMYIVIVKMCCLLFLRDTMQNNSLVTISCSLCLSYIVQKYLLGSDVRFTTLVCYQWLDHILCNASSLSVCNTVNWLFSKVCGCFPVEGRHSNWKPSKKYTQQFPTICTWTLCVPFAMPKNVRHHPLLQTRSSRRLATDSKSSSSSS